MSVVNSSMDFVREPRLPVPPMAYGQIAVEAPPRVPKLVPVNPLTRLLPAAMLVAALGMMALYFTSGATAMRNPMFMFFPVMMLTSVIGTLAYGARGANRTAEINQDRQSYLRYIDTLDSAISAATEDQRRSTRWRHPDPESLWTLAGGRRMWERRPDHPDFGEVRLGAGDAALCTTLVTPDVGTGHELDPVTITAMRGVIRQRAVVHDLPITLSLPAFPMVNVGGDPAVARALVRSIVCQLAVLHGPDHISILAVVGPDLRCEWDWLKWLPHYQHSQSDGGQHRHVVVILDGGETAGRECAWPGEGVTVIEIGTALNNMASTTGLHVDAERVSVQGDGDDEMTARPDLLTHDQALVCARRLAPYRHVVESGDDADRAAPPGWPGLMGIDDPCRLDPDELWRRHGGGQILPVPIGVSEDGASIELDINESARNGMGPHGLCVGATGSGKSEFLRTLTLGMIARHSPDALNLILVDFKGGATFLGLERARHVAAVITNLADEAHLVRRMHDALAGEINRRQELLRAAGNFANVAEYERARSHGASMSPLPALFILVDEFSELLSQHPDFAELFVTIGRLGRSLGMHLLLASQRIDEGRLRGLETHLSYRVCLKTFSASDSRAVLGVPDAYHLPSTPGAGYLKTASGDLARFQTAFVSGPCVRQRSEAHAASVASEGPVVFTAACMGATTARVDPRDGGDPPTSTLLDVVVDRLSGRGTPAHRVWLPPLTESPTLDMLTPEQRGCGLTVPIGLVDRPFEQRRDVLVAELAGAAGNVAVVGAPRSGKSTAVRTLLLALAEVHDPAEVGFYCLDFGGGALSSLRHVPHVGAVAGRSDVDLCRRVVAVVESTMRAREERFRRLGVDSIADYRSRRACGDPAVVDDPFGDVFLVVDGWATLRQEFESLEGPITAIAAQGLSFGIHVVVTASRWAELRPALKDQIATRIELRLGDPADSEVNRHRARQLTDRPPGRGITDAGQEMVIALPRWDGNATTLGIAEVVATNAERLRERCNGRGAPPVELLPTQVEHRELIIRSSDGFPSSQLMIGLGERELQPIAVDFDAQSHLLVLGEPGCGKTAVLRLLCREIMRTNRADEAQLEIVDLRRTLLGVVESEHLAGYSMSPIALTARLPAILDRLEARLPDETVTQQQLRTRSWWSGPEIYLVIDDYDLAAGATGNPLTPLADFLPHARDLGLHVIVARRSGGAARAMFDPVLARLRELGCMGLMMSASPDEGVLLGSVRPSRLPPGRATLVTRADEDQVIHVAWTDPP